MKVAMKARRVIVPASLQDKTLKHLHLDHMGIEKTRILACESMYLINMNDYIEETVKNCPACLDFQST